MKQHVYGIRGKVYECSACGNDHNIYFWKLQEPVTIKGKTFDHAGECIYTNITVYASMTFVIDSKSDPQ